MSTKAIKTFVFEEHNEAFYVWNHCVEKNWIPSEGNILFHVDEHSDMSVPRFNTSLHRVKGDLERVKDFTYQEVSIASFIIPSVFLGFFSQVYWIRQKHRSKNWSHHMYVRSYNNEGKKLLFGKANEVTSSQPTKVESDIRLFDYYLQTQEELPANQQVILDIDLDYFSCSGNPNEIAEISIEVTEEEYSRFVNQPFHRLRFLGSKVEAEKADGRYYIVFNNYQEVYPYLYPYTLKVDDETISQRIKSFAAVLESKNVNPLIINICRSRFSGYTPDDQWQFIENTLLEELRRLYNLEIIPVSQLHTYDLTPAGQLQ